MFLFDTHLVWSGLWAPGKPREPIQTLQGVRLVPGWELVLWTQLAQCFPWSLDNIWRLPQRCGKVWEWPSSRPQLSGHPQKYCCSLFCGVKYDKTEKIVDRLRGPFIVHHSSMQIKPIHFCHLRRVQTDFDIFHNPEALNTTVQFRWLQTADVQREMDKCCHLSH